MTESPVIVDLQEAGAEMIERLAEVVYESFREFAPDWLPAVNAAREVVQESLEPGRLSRVLLERDEPIGWAGGFHQYGRVWELHPLMVAATHRRRGYGRRLVDDMERLVAARGGLTLHLGTSDEMDRTTVFGIDLYKNPAQSIAELRTLREHPLDFYLCDRVQGDWSHAGCGGAGETDDHARQTRSASWTRGVIIGRRLNEVRTHHANRYRAL